MNIVEALHNEEAQLKRQLVAIQTAIAASERQHEGCVPETQRQFQWNEQQENSFRCRASKNYSSCQSALGEDPGGESQEGEVSPLLEYSPRCDVWIVSLREPYITNLALLSVRNNTPF